MEEIDLKELFEFYKERLMLIISIVAAVCLIGCVYSLLFQKPLYRSYTTVILGGNESSQNTTITQNDIAINKNLVDTYAEIVKSRRVLNPVIDELHLNMLYGQLYSKVGVTALNNTEIIKITVTDGNAILAKNIANVIAEHFTESVKELYNMDNVNVLDVAIQEEKPFNINVMKQLVIYFIVGFMLSAGLLFTIFYFDRTVKSTEQVEQKIKLPILGSVQKIGKEGKK